MEDTSDSLRFHAAGNIHRVSPQVIDEPFETNYPSDNRATVNPNPNTQRLVQLDIKTSHCFLHIDRKIGDRVSMVAPRRWQTSHDHIGIPNRFNLLHPMLFSQLIKHGEETV